MTIYLGEKAVGAGTIKATKAVAGDVLHDETLNGNGYTEPLGVDTVVMATTDNLNNKITVVNAAIDAQADAIAKTRNDFEIADQNIRADMNEKDSELESILNEHAEELTTLRGNQASLGDQVSNIESKIPQSASGSNPLITKQQLLDEEMDIRDDYNGMISELQTQITAQAGEIAKLDSEKIDKNQGATNAGKYLAVGDDGIVGLTTSGGGIADVIHDSTLTGKGTDDDQLGVNTEVIATKEDLESKQDKLTAGTNIKIEDNVISSTAQESFFRGRYKNWDSVPTNGLSYPNDIDGNHIPSNTDYIIIEDSSTVPGGQVDVQMTMETDAYLAFPNKKLETVINGITYNGTGIFDDGNIEVFCNTDAGNYTAHWKTLKNSVEYQGKTYEAGSVFFKVIIRPEKNTTQNAKLSLGNPYTGSWRFSYRGNWDLDNKNGWKAEYQIEEVLPIATETQAGINRTYTAGANIRIEDNVISSTAQESFFRGRFAEWTSVPTSSADYTADFHGNTTPSYNDYIVVEDTSLYIPQDFASDPRNVMIRNLHSAGVVYTIEVVIQDQIRRIYYTECTNGVYAQINDWLSVTYVGGAPGEWYIKTNKEFYINNVFTPTANKLLLLKTNTPYETNFYLSEKPGVAPVPIYGSWRFVYHGVWADDNILGWKPEYQIEETLPMATDTQAGIAKLYTTSGSNADGAMTQRAVGNAISAHNTATNAHSNIRGVAGGLATLDNNAKVPMAQINDALLGNVSYQGLWNATENVPFLADPSGDIQLPKGHYYITSVAGDRFGLHFDVGDWVISTGEGWTKVDNTDAVVAVNGRTGNVTLTADDVLPDQTDNAGKFLTTDGSTASWSDKPLVNTAEGAASLCVGGMGAQTTSFFATAVGTNSFCNANGSFGVAIGYSANVRASRAIQIGSGENKDANTLKVSNANGNFEMMSADGTIPADRMSTTAGTTGQVLTKTDTGMEWQDATGGSGGGSMPTRYVESINGFTGNVFLGCHEIGTYTSVEIDAMIGDIASVLDSINGEDA